MSKIIQDKLIIFVEDIKNRLFDNKLVKHKNHIFCSRSIVKEQTKYIFYAYGNPMLEIEEKKNKEIYFKLKCVIVY